MQASPPPPRTPPPASLLAWPHQVPVHAMQCVADGFFTMAMERGPAAWWQGWQRQRLGELLSWLGQNEAWQRWFDPLPTAGELHRLPVMRREHYRHMVEHQTPRVPASHGPLQQYDTSGSTGVPVVFWYSALTARINRDLYWADNQRHNRDMRAEFATISGKARPHSDSHIEIPPDPWLHPATQLARYSPAFSVEEHAHWLCNHAPAYLATYPALLSGMLSIIERKGLAAPRVSHVMTFAETVEPALRERTRRVLGARITDRYSCEELGPIAFQCPVSDDHYHAAVTNVIVEVTDPDGRPLPFGEPGTVLATGLHQWASPGVRYELGDVATLLPHCPACGVQVHTLTQLLGRKRALVQSPDGSLHYVRVLSEDWLGCAPVREHRMVQTAATHFRVELVLERPMTADERRAIDAMLKDRVGEAFSFEVHEMDVIPWPPGRKRQELVGLSAMEAAP